MEDFWYGVEMEWKKIAIMEYGKIIFYSIPCPLVSGATLSSFFLGHVLAFVVWFQFEWGSHTATILYYFTLSGLILNTFFIVPCCSFNFICYLNWMNLGTYILILKNSTDGEGSSFASLEEHRNFSNVVITESVCNSLLNFDPKPSFSKLLYGKLSTHISAICDTL